MSHGRIKKYQLAPIGLYSTVIELVTPMPIESVNLIKNHPIHTIDPMETAKVELSVPTPRPNYVRRRNIYIRSMTILYDTSCLI